MKINVCFIIGSILFLTSCSAKLTSSMQRIYAPLDYKEEVIVFDLWEETPRDAEKLGTVKVGDSGFTINCDYAVVIDKAKTEARKVGGNAIKITGHKMPDGWSSCHRITADVLRVDDIEYYTADAETEDFYSDWIDEDYAIINVYRAGGQGALVNYDLYLGDEILCRVTNNFCESIKVYIDGFNSLWARTETKAEIPINVEFGKMYYVRCGIKMGEFVGRPSLEMVDKKTGKIEFNAIQQKKNKKNK